MEENTSLHCRSVWSHDCHMRYNHWSCDLQVVGWVLLGAMGNNLVSNALVVINISREQVRGVTTTEVEVFGFLSSKDKLIENIINHFTAGLRFLTQVTH